MSPDHVTSAPTSAFDRSTNATGWPSISTCSRSAASAVSSLDLADTASNTSHRIACISTALQGSSQFLQEADVDAVQQAARLRRLARILAAGGFLWSLFCLPIMLVGVPVRTVPIFGPGYIVTVGYFARAMMPNPPSAAACLWARSIWWTSAVVQATWLGWWLSAVIENPRDPTLNTSFGIVVTVWWTFATLASIYGALTEPNVVDATETSQNQPPDQNSTC